MKRTLFGMTMFLLASASASAQGTIQFNNRVPGRVDAPVFAGPGWGLGAFPGAQAQLFLVTASGASATYFPLYPTTTFRTTSLAAMHYVVEPNEPVVVPGVPAGEQATVVLRAWIGGATYDAATPLNRAQSSPVTITLGGTPLDGSAPLVPAVLADLQGFTLPPFPEPSPFAIGLLGAAMFAFRRRKAAHSLS
jgi:hypothetical protein